MNNVISVIVPCYNLENYISNTIKSVLASSYQKIEIILVNDGSTDNTLQILNAYQKSDPRIKVIDQPNKGVSNARNQGLEVSNGEYIYFLDGDDTIDHTLFGHALDIFQTDQDIDLFSFGFNIVDEKNLELKKFCTKAYDKKILSNETFLNLFFQKKIRQNMCSFIIRKRILTQNNIRFSEDIRYGEDQEFQIRSLLACHYIYYDAGCYFHYLKRSSSAINTAQINFDSLIIFQRLKKTFFEKVQSSELRNNFNNYKSFFFILKWRKGVEMRQEKKYFDELDGFSECLKDTRLTFNKYGLTAYFFSKFYRIWKLLT